MPPLSTSGCSTCPAPTRRRIVAWAPVVAFAQMSVTPRSTRAVTVRTLGSTAPMATTADDTSCAPSWRSASLSVVSARAALVRWTARSCTGRSAESRPSTS